ncbi:MAG: LamG domain-containing protein, partial [Planctomycetes bacterium]|nr:LamG domain-containing protein [Planctomycetota bacterium]
MCKKLICLIASALCLGLAVTASADLVALYEFNGDLRDTGGNRAGPFDATVFSGTPEVNADGKLVLTRSDQDAITLGTVVGSAPDLTFALWVNSATESQFMRLLGKGDDNSSNPGWNVMVRPSGENNTFRPEWQGHGRGLWGNSVPVENAYVVGQWVHWTCTWDSATETLKIYVDGTLMETAVIAGANVANTANEMFVGRSGFGATEYFDGMVDDLAIWDEALTDEDVLAVFTLGPLALDPRMAIKPKPEDENGDVSRDVVLTWTPGEFAASRNVFMGTSFEDVNDASVADPLGTIVGQDLNTSEWDPGRLDFGQTYYWRVDEVNGAPDFTTFKGTVWSFTAEPFSIPISGITATAPSSFGASGPEKTIDGSGMVDDLHGTIAGDMWISGGIPGTIEYAFDRTYKLNELWIWNSNQVIESFVGFGAKDVVIDHSLDGENWTVLDGVGPLAEATGAAGYAHNNTIDFGGATAQHVRVTVNSVQGIAPQASLSEVRFFF